MEVRNQQANCYIIRFDPKKYTIYNTQKQFEDLSDAKFMYKDEQAAFSKISPAVSLSAHRRVIVAILQEVL